jgi:simple sugar transport system permease protein
MKKLFNNKGVQSLLASLICIVLGVLVGFIVLLLMNAKGAGTAITNLLKNFFFYPSAAARMKYFGTTLVKTAPLLMCALSILFAYKTGLFNIGAAGQYCIGVCACLFGALYLKLPWYLCLLMAVAAGALFGMAVGFLKAYCNVNEVISGIMLNWISLYITNSLLMNVKESTSPYTFKLMAVNSGALLPKLGPLNGLFGDNQYITIAVPIAIALAVIVWVLLEKTKFGYELKATGFNKNAAKYAGMAEKRNMIVTLIIAGALAGLGASFYYQTGIEQWEVTATSVPGMGFNGIAATFLGALNPIGTIFSSYFLQHITDGGTHINNMLYGSQIAGLISAVIIYLCGFVLFVKHAMSRIAVRGEENKDVRFEPIKIKADDEKEPAKDEEAVKEGGDN